MVHLLFTDNHTRPEPRGRRPARGPSNDLYAPMSSRDSPDISPTDRRRASGVNSYRKALAVLGTDHLPSSRTGSASSSHTPGLDSNHSDYTRHGSIGTQSSPAGMGHFDNASTIFNNNYSEPEFLSAAVPSYSRPGFPITSESARPDYNDDYRRPSVASATTVSSQGSKSSANGKYRKKLQGFFGDEYKETDGPRSDLDLGNQSQRGDHSSSDLLGFRGRANSDGARNMLERPPDQPRADTLPLSSEITPWVYQSYNVSFYSVELSFFRC